MPGQPRVSSSTDDDKLLNPLVELKQRVSAEFDRLHEVLGGGTVEEKRELIAHFALAREVLTFHGFVGESG